MYAAAAMLVCYAASCAAIFAATYCHNLECRAQGLRRIVFQSESGGWLADTTPERISTRWRR
jgi:hypothetical protein